MTQKQDMAQQIMAAFERAVASMKAGAEVQVKAAVEDYRAKRAAFEAAEPALQQAQQRVQELEAARADNAGALAAAMLDDDQQAIKAVQKAEKDRKADLAKAQKDLTKASDALGKVQFNLAAEAAAAGHVAVRAQRSVDTAVAQMIQALERALEEQRRSSVVVENFGILEESSKLAPTGRVHDADLEEIEQARQRAIKEYPVAL